MKPFVFALVVLLGFSSCNFAGLFLKDTPTLQTQAPTSTTGYMTDFRILVSDNTGVITSDISAFINATERKIYFSIPFNVYDNNLALIPRVTVTTGASYSPTGARYFKFPVSYDVQSGSSILTYTTSVTVTP